MDADLEEHGLDPVLLQRSQDGARRLGIGRPIVEGQRDLPFLERAIEHERSRARVHDHLDRLQRERLAVPGVRATRAGHGRDDQAEGREGGQVLVACGHGGAISGHQVFIALRTAATGASIQRAWASAALQNERVSMRSTYSTPRR